MVEVKDPAKVSERYIPEKYVRKYLSENNYLVEYLKRNNLYLVILSDPKNDIRNSNAYDYVFYDGSLSIEKIDRDLLMKHTRKRIAIVKYSKDKDDIEILTPLEERR